MEQELFDKIIDLIIQTEHECVMEGADKNPLIWGSNEGVALMSKKLQRNLWIFGVELNKEVSE